MKFGADIIVVGSAIVAGGAVATPGVPDGEFVGGVIVIVGAAGWGAGRAINEIGDFVEDTHPPRGPLNPPEFDRPDPIDGRRRPSDPFPIGPRF